MDYSVGRCVGTLFEGDCKQSNCITLKLLIMSSLLYLVMGQALALELANTCTANEVLQELLIIIKQ